MGVGEGKNGGREVSRPGHQHRERVRDVVNEVEVEVDAVDA